MIKNYTIYKVGILNDDYMFSENYVAHSGIRVKKLHGFIIPTSRY